MIKAVLIDYMGTLVSETSRYAQEVIGRCFAKSGARSPEEVAAFWFGKHDELMARSSAPTYQKEYDIALKTFAFAMEHYGFEEDANALCAVLEQHWINAPEFDDTRPFFEGCPVPIYVVTSNDTKYVTAGMARLGLKPAGVISSEMARAYKPRKEIFELALRVSGCGAESVVHIGDSVQADVQGARNAGITPWLLNREGRRKAEGVTVVSSLLEALKLLQEDGKAH